MGAPLARRPLCGCGVRSSAPNQSHGDTAGRYGPSLAFNPLALPYTAPALRLAGQGYVPEASDVRSLLRLPG